MEVLLDLVNTMSISPVKPWHNHLVVLFKSCFGSGLPQSRKSLSLELQLASVPRRPSVITNGWDCSTLGPVGQHQASHVFFICFITHFLVILSRLGLRFRSSVRVWVLLASSEFRVSVVRDNWFGVPIRAWVIVLLACVLIQSLVMHLSFFFSSTSRTCYIISFSWRIQASTAAFVMVDYMFLHLVMWRFLYFWHT